MKLNIATGAGIPKDSIMGRTITAMEITGPIPVMDIKIIAVTMQSRASSSKYYSNYHFI